MENNPLKPKQADPDGTPKIPGEVVGDGFPPEKDVSTPPPDSDQDDDADD